MNIPPQKSKRLQSSVYITPPKIHKKNSKHQFIYIYITYISPPKNFHTKKSPKTCPLFGVSIQKKQQQLTNGFESCLHRPWLPLRPSFFRLWSHWAFWRPEGVGSAGFLVGGWVPSTKHKGRVKATAATSFTPPKTNMEPLKRDYFCREYIWTNHWFSTDMFVFRGVSRVKSNSTYGGENCIKFPIDF